MSKKIKKIVSFFLMFTIITTPVFAKNNFKSKGEITHEFNVANMPEQVIIKSKEEITVKNETIIPANSIITAEVLEAQKERRWHKSGFIVCRLVKYKNENANEEVDITNKNIYFAIRKYEALDKKEAAILTTEIILTQAAGIVGSCFIFFAPVDIAYFFTKGAIQKQKHPNWFKAGVYNAYDNSIFWFWLKGKPIDIKENQPVKLKGLKEKKALKLKKQISKRKEKQSLRNERQRIKKENKINKKTKK